jgi:ornithine cyclodeaminase/alanine dehydrogenase-like protein (mu-crystallin family)
MDVVAVVGTGNAALAMLHAALVEGIEVVSVSPRPHRMREALEARVDRATLALGLDGVRFTDDLESVNECSIVFDCTEDAEPAARTQALAALEARITPGAVLASAADDVGALARSLARPAQFVGIRRLDGALAVIATDETSPGVAGWAEMLCDRLSRSGHFAQPY